MQNPLISLIVPCYNIEKICDHFFQSLLEQTYTNIQLILIDDGSTDNTAQKLQSYQKELESIGYSFEYHYQKNKGLGGAINTGLKYILGEYFCWADSDDYYEPNAFQVRVDYLREHPECMVLEADAYEWYEGKDTYHSRLSTHFPATKEPKQFLLLLNYNSNFCSGCHMVKTEAFRQVNPEMDIYEARRGQNWQLLLPVYYAFDRHYLDVPVYNYIVYQNSMSHIPPSYEARLQRCRENYDIQSETLKRMRIPAAEKEQYLQMVEILTTQLYMYAARKYHKKEEFKKFYKILGKYGKLTWKDRLRWLAVMWKEKG